MSYILANRLEGVNHILNLDQVNGRRRGKETGELLSTLDGSGCETLPTLWPTVSGVNGYLSHPVPSFGQVVKKVYSLRCREQP